MRQLFAEDVDARRRQCLERGEPGAKCVLRAFEQLHRMMQRGYGGPRGHLRRRQREQLHRRRGDDAQRTFSANEKITQIVASVVLAQAAQAVPDLAIGGHHFEPETELARIAVAQHRHATGIGRQIAANRARAFRAQRQRKQPVGIARHVLQVLQNTARLHGHCVVQRVNFAHAVQPRQRQQQCPTGTVRHTGAGHAGVATLRHDRHLIGGTPAHDGGDVLGGIGQRHGNCLARPALAPVDQEWRHIGGVGQQAARKAALKGVDWHGN